MILEKAKEFKDLPVIFSGDLNFIEKSLGYRDITADILKDTKVLANGKLVVKELEHKPTIIDITFPIMTREQARSYKRAFGCGRRNRKSSERR